jgi:hypothetical protein
LEGLCVAGGGFVLWFLGPFGTYALPSLTRLAYWLGLTLFAYLLIKPLLFLGRTRARRLGISVQAGEVAALLTGAFVVALTISILLARLFPTAARTDFEVVLAQVGVIGLLIYAAIRLVVGAGSPFPAVARPGEDGGPGGRSASPAFFERLPGLAPEDLLCLRMEDHYVRVHHSAGSTLLLMRLRDAVAELGPMEGLRVGRSWWVARHAVTRILRQGRAVKLELLNGLIIPVSRSHLPLLKRAGWMDDRLLEGRPSGQAT